MWLEQPSWMLVVTRVSSQKPGQTWKPTGYTELHMCVRRAGEIAECVQLIMLCDTISRFNWLYRENNLFEAAEPRPVAGRIQ